MTKTIMAAVLAATMLAAPAAYAQSNKGVPTISAQDREAQQAWWSARAERHAERRMAACMAMPECKGGQTIAASPMSKG